MKVEFDFDGEGIPHMGIAVVLAVDDEGDERISILDFGDPDILRVSGMLRGVTREVDGQLDEMLGTIPYEDE